MSWRSGVPVLRQGHAPFKEPTACPDSAGTGTAVPAICSYNTRIYGIWDRPEGWNQALFPVLTQEMGTRRETATEDIAGAMMRMRDDVRDEMIRHLLDAVEQVRRDMAKVELWASALNGFSRPIPEYDPGQVTVWMPREQADKLKRSDHKRKS